MKALVVKNEKAIIDVSVVVALAIIGTYFDSSRFFVLNEVVTVALSVASLGFIFYMSKIYVSPLVQKFTPWKK